MSVSTILLSEFADPRFRAAFQSYFAELGFAVKDWDGLFREMDEEKINRACLALDEGGGVVGFLQFQLTADDAVGFYLANGYERAPGVRAKNNMEVLVKVLR